jgi:uncharacterized membrane protein YecN with MAPEG domain
MTTVLLCSAFLVFLYALLSVNVSRIRLRGQQSSRVKEAQLTQAVRAHGNAAEYIPLIVALLLYLNQAAPNQLVSVIAVIAALSRALHAAAMLFVPEIHLREKLRFVGALGTYVSLFALGCVLVGLAL